ncbi:MAG: DUF1735 domain-containing protein [Bacteroidales bacterium]|nr:DUF1735 domain-containing protein [Bacteroidales bacterium]
MKKTLIYILSLAAIAGCIADDRNYNMVDDSFSLTARETLIQTSVHTGGCSVGIAKNGKGQTAASVTVSASATDCAQALAGYNQARGTAFVPVPESLFALSDAQIAFGKEEVVKDLHVSWDAARLAEEIGESADYVIPLLIRSSELDVNEEKNFVLIQVLRSAISVTQTALTRSVAVKNVEPDPSGRQPALQETITLDLESNNAIRNVGMEFPVLIDNSLVETYNQTAETPAQAAPEGLVRLLTESVSIPESGKSATFKIELDKSVLLGPDGKLQEFPDYVVPVRVDKDRVKASRKGEDFDLRGIAYGNLVTYLTIRYQKSTGSVIVSREWGRYSTAEAAWNAYFGGTAGSERNVAMDDDYIYIAEFNNTKNLWAIDRQNPASVKKVPIGTVESEGFADIYLTCPRVLPNEDPAVNGGRDVLVVSNLATGQKLKMYFYINGTAEDPSVVNFNIWADRRLGDTWSFWGTLQKGMFYMKDFDDATALMTFKQEGRTSGNNSLQGRFVMPAAGSGAAAWWPFPEDKNAGLYGIRNKINSFSVRFQSDSWTAIGGNETTSTQLSGYYENCAFQYIEYAGKRYIAYTRQVDGGDGRLFILEGKATDSWDSIIAERNVIYHAAIQNEFEGEGDVEASPRSSSHNGMDLCVRETGGDIYIAVVKQNVGLSLFKMALN